MSGGGNLTDIETLLKDIALWPLGALDMLQRKQGPAFFKYGPAVAGGGVMAYSVTIGSDNPMNLLIGYVVAGLAVITIIEYGETAGGG